MKALPISGDAKSYAVLLGVGVVGVIVLYFFVKSQAKAAAMVVGDIASGNNELTRGTPYEDAGIVGTIAAAENVTSGGLLQNIGDHIGGALADLHDWFVLDDPTKTPKLQSRKQATQDNFHIDSSGVFLP